MTEEDKLIKVILALREGLTLIVEQLNEVLATYAPEMGPERGIPKIDLGDLDAAPWLTYHTKVRAEPGTAAWMKNPTHFTQFEAPPVIHELVKAIKRSPGERLQLGAMEYGFSGERKFLSRRPVKK